uniref:Uncharacterized protein n=1 Tax=Arundo donax TaxID=35708 RepID=A0A0A8ZXM6_ARUDO
MATSSRVCSSVGAGPHTRVCSKLERCGMRDFP